MRLVRDEQPTASGLAASCIAAYGTRDVQAMSRNADPSGLMYDRKWYGSIAEGKAAPSGLEYARNQYYDPTAGRFTQEDPAGLGGGTNLYGYAGADPANNNDPFGLCPPKDKDPCNTSTGDPNLDNTASRQRMEDSYKNAPDSSGYKLEQGGRCQNDGSCQGYSGSTGNIDIPVNRNTSFDWHTHGNVGMPVPGDPGNVFTRGASEPDISSAALAYRVGIREPSYILDDKNIYRLSPGTNGAVVITTFSRWNP